METRSQSRKSTVNLKGYSKTEKGITYMQFQHPENPTYQFCATLGHIQRYLVQNDYVHVSKWLFAKRFADKLVIVAKPDFLVILQGDGRRNVTPSSLESDEMKQIIAFADIFILFISFECTTPNCCKARSRKKTDFTKVPLSTGKNFLAHCSVVTVTKTHARYFDILNNQNTMKCLHYKKQREVEKIRYNRKASLPANTFSRSEFTNQFNKAKKFLQDRGVLRSPLSVVIYECPFIITEDMGCALLPLVVLHMITKKNHSFDTTLENLLPMHDASKFLRNLQELCDLFSTPYCRTGILAKEISPSPIRFDGFEIRHRNCTKNITCEADNKRKRQVTAWLQPHVKLPRCDAAEKEVNLRADDNWKTISKKYEYVYEPDDTKPDSKRQKQKYSVPYVRKSRRNTRLGPPTIQDQESYQTSPFPKSAFASTQ